MNGSIGSYKISSCSYYTSSYTSSNCQNYQISLSIRASKFSSKRHLFHKFLSKCVQNSSSISSLKSYLIAYPIVCLIFDFDNPSDNSSDHLMIYLMKIYSQGCPIIGGWGNLTQARASPPPHQSLSSPAIFLKLYNFHSK